MNLLAHAQRLIELDKAATPGPLVVRPARVGYDVRTMATVGKNTDGTYRGDGDPIAIFTSRADAQLFVAARTSPDVARALLRAVELLTATYRHGTQMNPVEYVKTLKQIDAFLASLNLPDAGQGRV